MTNEFLTSRGSMDTQNIACHPEKEKINYIFINFEHEI